MGAHRHEWTFHYKALDVAAAASERAAYHSLRERTWLDTLDQAERDLREKGVDFRDREVTGGNRIEAVVDPELSNRVNECRQKVEHHRRKGEEYQAYAVVLGAHPDDQLHLAVDDVQFFGLA